MTQSSNGIASVLVIDDDQDLRRVLMLALTDEGYTVRAAPNGRDALALLESWRPDVILLDLMMPEMDGCTFRARQLATPGSEDVPVIVLSAARETKAEALRPAAIVAKPFNLPDLLDTVAAIAR